MPDEYNDEMMEIGASDLEAIENELGIQGLGDYIGARAKNRSRKLHLAQDRSRGIKRVLPLPFDKAEVTDDGDAVVLTANSDKPAKPVKIFVVTTTGILYVTGILIQGDNQLLGAGFIPHAVFAEDSPSEDMPWDFDQINTSGHMVIQGVWNGTTEGTEVCSATAKCLAARA